MRTGQAPRKALGALIRRIFHAFLALVWAKVTGLDQNNCLSWNMLFIVEGETLKPKSLLRIQDTLYFDQAGLSFLR